MKPETLKLKGGPLDGETIRLDACFLNGDCLHLAYPRMITPSTDISAATCEIVTVAYRMDGTFVLEVRHR